MLETHLKNIIACTPHLTQHLFDVVCNIKQRDRERIFMTGKDYCVIFSSRNTIKLVDDPAPYTSKEGMAIYVYSCFEIDQIINLVIIQETLKEKFPDQELNIDLLIKDFRE